MSKKKLKIKKAKKSDIVLSGMVTNEIEEASEDLQRTKVWREDRRGRWTGVQFKTLMACNSKGGRMSWNEKSKIFLLSDGAMKAMYENAMERKTGRYIDTGDGTKQMRYGTKVEPLIFKQADEQLAAMGILEQVGFKRFPNMKEAGVSSDSILRDSIPQKNGLVIATVEMKACTTWTTHFNRTFELMDDKSVDFWQTQGQMIAWNVSKCYYIVAEPPISIDKYLYYQGDIMDLYSDFYQECPISIQEIDASPMHQEALLARIAIGEDVINKWLENTSKNLRKIMYNVIDIHKNLIEEIEFKDEKVLEFDLPPTNLSKNDGERILKAYKKHKKKKKKKKNKSKKNKS